MKSSSSPTEPKSPNAATTSASPGSTAVPLESKSPKVTPVTSERPEARRRGQRGARREVVGCDVSFFFWGGVGFTSLGGSHHLFFSGKCCLCNCCKQHWKKQDSHVSCWIGQKCVNKKAQTCGIVGIVGIVGKKLLFFCSAAKKKRRKKKMDAALACANDGNHAFQRFQSWRHCPVGYEVSGMEVKSTN